jgi:hypothetical protein
MDREEARQVLQQALDPFRSMPFDQLVAQIGSNQVFERAGPSGNPYQIEIDVVWDDPRIRRGAVRVLGAIDDGRLPGAIFPLTEDLLIEAKPGPAGP